MIKRASILLCAAMLAACVSGGDRRQAYIEANPDTRFAQQIAAGQIRVGMTKEEVEASWGPPCGLCYGTRQTSTGTWWEYSISPRYPGHVLHFDNRGRLTYWSK